MIEFELWMFILAFGAVNIVVSFVVQDGFMYFITGIVCVFIAEIINLIEMAGTVSSYLHSL